MTIIGRLRARPAAPLSVILPVHNGSPFVEECIRSLLCQTEQDFELVVGDDGSTDATGSILARLAAADSRIRLLRRDRPSGLVEAANWLVGEAQAPRIAVAHADDIWHPNRLKAQMALMDREPSVVLVGTAWRGVDSHGRVVRPADNWRFRFASPFPPFSHSSIMFNRSAFEHCGGYRANAEYWEDLDLYYRMAEIGEIAALTFPYSMVRHTAASTMLNQPRETVERQVDDMVRATHAIRKGAAPAAAVSALPTSSDRLHPQTFIRYGSTNVWAGRPPGTLRSLLVRGRLKFDLPTFRAVAVLTWGTVSPRSLRLFQRLAIHLRNFITKPALDGIEAVRWTPMKGARVSLADNPNFAPLMVEEWELQQ